MKVLVLVAAIAVLVRARPEAGYSYSAPSAPSNTYGTPGGGFIGGGAGGAGGIGISSGSFSGGGAGALIGGIGPSFQSLGGFSSGIGPSSQSLGGFSSGIGTSSLPVGGLGGDISSGAGYSGGSLIQKHIYVHVPPPEQEELINRPPPQFRPAQKHYKIVFIKAPTPPTPTAANIQLPGQDEQKTLIYVLVKKPDEAEALNIQQPAPTQPSKPEVYFIKYKTQKQVTSGGALSSSSGIGVSSTYGAPAASSASSASSIGVSSSYNAPAVSTSGRVSSTYGAPGASGPY